MFRNIFAGAAALFLGCGAAAAQVAVDGPYAGGLLGYEWGQADANYSLPAAGGGRLTDDSSFDVNGWDLGGYVGYRIPTPSGFVLAFEGGMMFANPTGEANESFGGRSIRTKFEKSNEFYVSARGGIVVQDAAMIYGIAGLQTASFEGKVRDRDTGERIAQNDEYLGGWSLGLGAEYFLANNVSTRLEWQYQSYSEMSLSGGGGRAKIDPSANVLRLGVSYNF